MSLGESPTFGKILDIVCANEQTLLFLELYRIINFDDHYHAYSVESMQKKSFVSVTNLPFPHVLHLYKNFDHHSHDVYIVQKYGLCNL